MKYGTNQEQEWYWAVPLGDLGPACGHVQAGLELSVTNGREKKLVPLAKTQRTAEDRKSKQPRSKLRGIEKQSLKDLIGVDQHAECDTW